MLCTAREEMLRRFDDVPDATPEKLEGLRDTFGTPQMHWLDHSSCRHIAAAAVTRCESAKDADVFPLRFVSRSGYVFFDVPLPTPGDHEMLSGIFWQSFGSVGVGLLPIQVGFRDGSNVPEMITTGRAHLDCVGILGVWNVPTKVLHGLGQREFQLWVIMAAVQDFMLSDAGLSMWMDGWTGAPCGPAEPGVTDRVVTWTVS